MIKFNNETIKNFIMDALDKKERGIEISEVDRNELINVILKYGDRDFGIDTANRKYTEEELKNSVYIHINEINENKCYIGQTSRNPKDRWGYNGNGYNKNCPLIHRAIKKYTWNNFSHVVLCYGLSKEQANNMEILLISLFESTNGEFGYNIQNGGNAKGKHSKESIAKISEAHKGEKHHMYSKHHSEETKKKMSEAQKGEKHHMYGKHHSKEARKKMSEAQKGKQVSEETKKKISEAKKGGKSHKAKKVCCNGKIFGCITECAEFYNVNRRTMSYWLQGKNKIPSEFIEKGLRYATEEDINTYPLYIEEEQNQ